MNTNVELTTKIARICHEANKAYCESIGDASQKDWEHAEEWQRQSAVKGVEFRIDNPDAPASAQHDSWMKEKTDDGWKYGQIKDAQTKTHPCIVPYEELPIKERKKDYLFQAIVDALK